MFDRVYENSERGYISDIASEWSSVWDGFVSMEKVGLVDVYLKASLK